MGYASRVSEHVRILNLCKGLLHPSFSKEAPCCLQLMQVAWQDYEPVSGQDMPAACPQKETGGVPGKLLGASFQPRRKILTRGLEFSALDGPRSAPGCAGKPSEGFCGVSPGALKGLSGASFQPMRKILMRGLEFSAVDTRHARGGPRRPQESPGSLPRAVPGALFGRWGGFWEHVFDPRIRFLCVGWNFPP